MFRHTILLFIGRRVRELCELIDFQVELSHEIVPELRADVLLQLPVQNDLAPSPHTHVLPLLVDGAVELVLVEEFLRVNRFSTKNSGATWPG